MNDTFVYILCIKKNKYVDELHNAITNSQIITDDIYTDDLMISKNFNHLIQIFNKPTSWEKCFYHLNENSYILDKYKYFYFIEDDVYCKDVNTFNTIIDLLLNNSSDLITHNFALKTNNNWFWWKKEKDLEKYSFKRLSNSFNPFCRLSSRLIKDILYFRYKHKKFIFLEIMFSCIADNMGYSIENFRDIDKVKNYFGKFLYRPAIKNQEIIDNKIYHPYKLSRK